MIDPFSIANPMISISALAGFFISVYIRYAKSRSGKLVCPLGADCNAVIQSKYSKTFGIPNETLGMVYFALILYIYGTNRYSEFNALVVIIGFAALFSFYLLIIQFLKLKAFCEWCISTTIISFIIFFAILFFS